MSTLWENQLIRIRSPDGSKSLVVGNLYRPPKVADATIDNCINTFITEFSSGLNTHNETNANIALAGDFNINLLKINDDHTISS